MNKVIPRDLFNDGNLLTNYGNLYIALEKIGKENLLRYREDHHFSIITDKSDGSTWIANVELNTPNKKSIHLFRNLNSRDSKSLWFRSKEEDYEVFNEDGTLTNELLEIL